MSGEPAAEGGIITAIRSQRRHTERANLHVGGDFCCGVAWEVVLAEGLRAGDPVDADTLQRLRRGDEGWRARQATLSLLATRPRSRRELETRLRGRDFSPAAIMHALDAAQRAGLLDDVAFAEAWVRDRLRLRPRGSRALVAELVRKGLPRDTGADIVARVMSGHGADDDDLCARAAEKWAGRNRRQLGEETSPGTRHRLERRLLGYLTRRGYPLAAARSATRAALQQPPTPSARHTDSPIDMNLRRR
jgi:regulatory protein